MGADAARLLSLVRDNPGRTANWYAVEQSLPHAYTRRLLSILKELGDLDSYRVTAYRAKRGPQ